MKEIWKLIISSIGTYALMYLMFVFVLWEFNPGLWKESTRFLAAMFGTLASVMVVVLIKTDE